MQTQAESTAPAANPLSVLRTPIAFGSLAFAFLSWALPIYAKNLGATALEIGGLFSVWALVMAVLRPAVGWGLDRAGRKPFFVAALVCYAAAMVVYALLQSLVGVYIGQLIRGLGSAMMWISAYTLATELAPDTSRGAAVGYVDESTARGQLYGAIAGFVIFSQLPADTGWRLVFAGYAAMAALAAWLGWRRVPETRLAFTGDPGGAPPVSNQLLRLMVVVFVTAASTAMLSPIFLVFLQDRFTRDIGTLILAIIPAALVSSYLPSRMGRLSDRYGRTYLMVAGLLGSAVVSFFLPILPGLVPLAVVWTIEALGWAVAGPAQEAMVADMTGLRVRGRGYGLYTFAASLGAAAGPIVGGYLYEYHGHEAPFYLNSAILLVNVALVLLLLRPKAAAATPG